MDSGKITPNYHKDVTFLNLPELILRRIFCHLDDHTVYLVMGHICQKIRKYVEAYIKLCGIFVDVSIMKFPMRKLYVFKRYDKMFSIHCFLEYSMNCRMEWVDFGGFVDGTIVVGKCASLGPNCYALPDLYEEYQQEYDNSEFKTRIEEQIESQLGYILCEFDSKHNTWDQFPTNPHFYCKRRLNRPYYTAYCQIDDCNILLYLDYVYGGPMP